MLSSLFMWLSLLLGSSLLGSDAISRPSGVVGNDDSPLVVLYWEAWGVWTRKFLVSDLDRYLVSRNIPYKQLVINHAFTAPNMNTCAIELVEWEADTKNGDEGYGIPYYGNPWDGPVATGNLGALMMLKQSHPEVILLPSLGGWSRSHSFRNCTAPDKREAFVDSLINFITYFRWDGVDLDWEYPECEGGCGCQMEATCPETSNYAGTGDWAVYVDFLNYLRQRFTTAGESLGRYLWITMAIGMNYDLLGGTGKWANPTPFDKLCAADSPVDWMNLMTYDFFGTWAADTGALAPMGDHPDTDKDDKMNALWGLEYMKDKCADKSKLTIGLATYGKAWKSVPKEGNPPGLYKTSTLSTGFAAKGTYEDGTVSYWDIQKNLVPACTRTFDDQYTHTPTLFCDSSPSGESNVFVSYEDAESWAYKMKFARDYGMSGGIIWAASDMKEQATSNEYIGELFKGLIDGWTGGSVTIEAPPSQIVCPTPYLWWTNYACPFDKECFRSTCDYTCTGLTPGDPNELVLRPGGPLQCKGGSAPTSSPPTNGPTVPGGIATAPPGGGGGGSVTQPGGGTYPGGGSGGSGNTDRASTTFAVSAVMGFLVALLISF